MDAYEDFLRAKIKLAPSHGFALSAEAVNPQLKPHCQAIVPWAVEKGRAAIFASFGLHKTSMQMEWLRQIRTKAGGEQLIVAPLNARREFFKEQTARFAEGSAYELKLKFIQSTDQVDGGDHAYITNFESVREGKIDVSRFNAVTLDEASVLRGFGGTKTFREFMRLFETTPYRLVATATPAPNDYIEFLAYSAYLGVMDVGEAKTRFFRRNSEKADQLTLHPHKEREFWLWVASWAVMLTKPSDLGFSDEGYVLPDLKVITHEIALDAATENERIAEDRTFFQEASASVVSASRVKRQTLGVRVAKAAEIVAAAPEDHFLLWHDLEDERRALDAAVPGILSVFGSQGLEEREQIIDDFAEGRLRRLGAKPVMLGSGGNLQHHCHKMVFVGIGPKFNDFIQAIHRLLRFGQQHEVECHLILSESERATLNLLTNKWRQHEEARAKMAEIIREFGLNAIEISKALTRSLGVERAEVTGDGFTCVNNDCVVETKAMETNSVDLIVSSIPFSTQYEYSPSYNDFGHTDDNDHFWAQMDFLIPELKRVLKPGRDACIHVKNRIVPGGINGLGFQTVHPFADECRAAFMRHGFAYLGEHVNTTDVVRENNQTYRLGHSEQLKDGTRMGSGMSEYVLIFRKPPSDLSNGYADVPVQKPRETYVDGEGQVVEYDRRRRDIKPLPGTGYSRARWQLDAHGHWRSSGDRLFKPEELAAMDSAVVRRIFEKWSLEEVYDYEHHVKICEQLAFVGRLPPTFMLLPPFSWDDGVWSDVAQMLSLNTAQSQASAEKHLCPLPFDIVDRLIRQRSQPGELIFDPFAGLMTVPYRALKLGRRGYGVELSPAYFLDGVKYCEAMAREKNMPSLFDFLEEEQAA